MTGHQSETEVPRFLRLRRTTTRAGNSGHTDDERGGALGLLDLGWSPDSIGVLDTGHSGLLDLRVSATRIRTLDGLEFGVLAGGFSSGNPGLTPMRHRLLTELSDPTVGTDDRTGPTTASVAPDSGHTHSGGTYAQSGRSPVDTKAHVVAATTQPAPTARSSRGTRRSDQQPHHGNADSHPPGSSSSAESTQPPHRLSPVGPPPVSHRETAQRSSLSGARTDDTRGSTLRRTASRTRLLVQRLPRGSVASAAPERRDASHTPGDNHAHGVGTPGFHHRSRVHGHQHRSTETAPSPSTGRSDTVATGPSRRAVSEPQTPPQLSRNTQSVTIAADATDQLASPVTSLFRDISVTQTTATPSATGSDPVHSQLAPIRPGEPVSLYPQPPAPTRDRQPRSQTDPQRGHSGGGPAGVDRQRVVATAIGRYSRALDPPPVQPHAGGPVDRDTQSLPRHAGQGQTTDRSASSAGDTSVDLYVPGRTRGWAVEPRMVRPASASSSPPTGGEHTGGSDDRVPVELAWEHRRNTAARQDRVAKPVAEPNWLGLSARLQQRVQWEQQARHPTAVAASSPSALSYRSLSVRRSARADSARPRRETQPPDPRDRRVHERPPSPPQQHDSTGDTDTTSARSVSPDQPVSTVTPTARAPVHLGGLADQTEPSLSATASRQQWGWGVQTATVPRSPVWPRPSPPAQLAADPSLSHQSVTLTPSTTAAPPEHEQVVDAQTQIPTAVATGSPPALSYRTHSTPRSARVDSARPRRETQPPDQRHNRARERPPSPPRQHDSTGDTDTVSARRVPLEQPASTVTPTARAPVHPGGLADQTEPSLSTTAGRQQWSRSLAWQRPSPPAQLAADPSLSHQSVTLPSSTTAAPSGHEQAVDTQTQPSTPAASSPPALSSRPRSAPRSTSVDSARPGRETQPPGQRHNRVRERPPSPPRQFDSTGGSDSVSARKVSLDPPASTVTPTARTPVPSDRLTDRTEQSLSTTAARQQWGLGAQAPAVSRSLALRPSPPVQLAADPSLSHMSVTLPPSTTAATAAAAGSPPAPSYRSLSVRRSARVDSTRPRRETQPPDPRDRRVRERLPSPLQQHDSTRDTDTTSARSVSPDQPVSTVTPTARAPVHPDGLTDQTEQSLSTTASRQQWSRSLAWPRPSPPAQLAADPSLSHQSVTLPSSTTAAPLGHEPATVRMADSPGRYPSPADQSIGHRRQTVSATQQQVRPARRPDSRTRPPTLAYRFTAGRGHEQAVDTQSQPSTPAASRLPDTRTRTDPMGRHRGPDLRTVTHSPSAQGDRLAVLAAPRPPSVPRASREQTVQPTASSDHSPAAVPDEPTSSTETAGSSGRSASASATTAVSPAVSPSQTPQPLPSAAAGGHRTAGPSVLSQPVWAPRRDRTESGASPTGSTSNEERLSQFQRDRSYARSDGLRLRTVSWPTQRSRAPVAGGTTLGSQSATTQRVFRDETRDLTRRQPQSGGESPPSPSLSRSTPTHRSQPPRADLQPRAQDSSAGLARVSSEISVSRAVDGRTALLPDVAEPESRTSTRERHLRYRSTPMVLADRQSLSQTDRHSAVAVGQPRPSERDRQRRSVSAGEPAQPAQPAQPPQRDGWPAPNAHASASADPDPPHSSRLSQEPATPVTTDTVVQPSAGGQSSRSSSGRRPERSVSGSGRTAIRSSSSPDTRPHSSTGSPAHQSPAQPPSVREPSQSPAAGTLPASTARDTTSNGSPTVRVWTRQPTIHPTTATTATPVTTQGVGALATANAWRGSDTRTNVAPAVDTASTRDRPRASTGTATESSKRSTAVLRTRPTTLVSRRRKRVVASGDHPDAAATGEPSMAVPSVGRLSLPAHSERASRRSFADRPSPDDSHLTAELQPPSRPRATRWQHSPGIRPAAQSMTVGRVRQSPVRSFRPTPSSSVTQRDDTGQHRQRPRNGQQLRRDSTSRRRPKTATPPTARRHRAQWHRSTPQVGQVSKPTPADTAPETDHVDESGSRSSAQPLFEDQPTALVGRPEHGPSSVTPGHSSAASRRSQRAVGLISPPPRTAPWSQPPADSPTVTSGPSLTAATATRQSVPTTLSESRVSSETSVTGTTPPTQIHADRAVAGDTHSGDQTNSAAHAQKHSIRTLQRGGQTQTVVRQHRTLLGLAAGKQPSQSPAKGDQMHHEGDSATMVLRPRSPPRRREPLQSSTGTRSQPSTQGQDASSDPTGVHHEAEHTPSMPMIHPRVRRRRGHSGETASQHRDASKTGAHHQSRHPREQRHQPRENARPDLQTTSPPHTEARSPGRGPIGTDRHPRAAEQSATDTVDLADVLSSNVTADQTVSKLYRELERKIRIERQRRGL